MKSVLITGSNRGIGLGLVKEFITLPNPPEHIIATCRNYDQAKELQDIAKESKSVSIIVLDVTDSKSYDKFVKEVSDIVGENGLNCLINNAGIISKRGKLEGVDEDELIKVYKVNTVAPIMLTQALLPLLRTGAKSSEGSELSWKALIVNVTSQIGSIQDNGSAGFYGYRCSKAALNMATKSMSIELNEDDIKAICIHPGWVQTDMGGPNARLRIKDSVKAMVQTIMSLKPTDNGAFLRFNGEIIPW